MGCGGEETRILPQGGPASRAPAAAGRGAWPFSARRGRASERSCPRCSQGGGPGTLAPFVTRSCSPVSHPSFALFRTFLGLCSCCNVRVCLGACLFLPLYNLRGRRLDTPWAPVGGSMEVGGKISTPPVITGPFKVLVPVAKPAVAQRAHCVRLEDGQKRLCCGRPGEGVSAVPPGPSLLQCKHSLSPPACQEARRGEQVCAPAFASTLSCKPKTGSFIPSHPRVFPGCLNGAFPPLRWPSARWFLISRRELSDADEESEFIQPARAAASRSLSLSQFGFLLQGRADARLPRTVCSHSCSSAACSVLTDTTLAPLSSRDPGTLGV